MDKLICLLEGCGGELQYIGEDPYCLCGGILYFTCPKCGTSYQDDQSGILPLNAGLEIISEPPTNLVKDDDH